MRPDSATPEPGEPTAPEPGEPTAPEPGGMPHDRLHIAMFTDFPPGSLGGISTAVDDQRRALERLGHRVTVFAPAPTDPEAAVPTWLVAVPAPRALSVNGFPFVVPTRGVLAAVENELIRRAPIDVVHVHTTYGVAILGAKIARRHHIPLVQTMHSRDDVFVERTSPAPWASAVGMRILHRCFVSPRLLTHGGGVARVAESRTARQVWHMMLAQARTADVVIAPTEHFADRLRRHGLSGDIRVVSGGVDDDLLATLPQRSTHSHDDPLRLLWCGRISAEKRPMVAVEAVASTPGCTLDILGSGDQEHHIRTLVDEFGLRQRIRLLGSTDRAGVLAAMADADALLFTSAGFDTQGLVLLEAAAAGLPVIYCDPDLDETVPTGGGLRAADPSADSVAAVIAAVIADPARLAARDALSDKAVPQSRMTRQTIGIYRELVGTERLRRGSMPVRPEDVPSAPGRVPGLGHSVVALRQGLHFIVGLGRIGPVVRVDLGTRPAYLVTTPELIRQIGFRTAGEFHRADLQEAMHEAIREASNVLSGRRHEMRRRQMAPALRARRLARYAVTTAAIADDWSRGLPHERPVDLRTEAHGLILQTVTSTLFRADFGADALDRVRETVPWLLGEVIIRGALPAPVRRMRMRANRRFARDSAMLREAIGAVVRRYRSQGVDHGDVLSVLVGHTDEDTGIGLSDDEIIDELLLMVAAGVGSTASILAWVWYEVARNPHVSSLVAQEVERVVGEGPVHPDHLEQLTYLRRVVAETLRMWGPWISSQTADGPVTLGDDETGRLTLPDGSTVIYSPYLVLHDPRFYTDPETFDPDRWQPDRAEYLDRKADLAFGVGERHCPGNTFAISTILLCSAALYSRWTVRPAGRRRVRPSTTDFVAAPSQVRVRLEPRR
ncbi:MAG TPA: cytochrome P450 [Gordonia polyisoprenivorans]|uniref:Cytochrome P450 n=3 Tax=Gordonia polyisoprenivorans TaxID=84595 RepID=A0A846WM68_9ACTN|nr:cytochrome P450 [Gordonia polyisoprenivorans]NKY02725.1 cytochrome P450 [Gordonia polyisoprenivorans]HCS56869.1 cytochrome P450 [Gordonia polyisoprenivorans]